MDADDTGVKPADDGGDAGEMPRGAGDGAPERHFAPLPSLKPERQPGWRRTLPVAAAVVVVIALAGGIMEGMAQAGRLSGAQSANHARATAAAATQTAQAGPFVSRQAQIAGMAFISSTDGWVVMQDVSNNGMNNLLYHYANGKYTKTTIPPHWGLFNARLWSFAPDNLWVSAGGGGAVYHYDGHTWIHQTFPAPPNFEGVSGPSALTMVSPTEGWAIGDAFAQSNGAQYLTQVFYHYDGSAWRIDPADSQASKGAPGGVPTPTPDGTLYSGSDQIQLTGISATPAGDVWATGYLQIQDGNGNPTSTTGYLYHRVNGVWRVAQVMRNTELDDILMTGANSGWIMGKTIISKKVITPIPITTTKVTPIVLGWDGARWSPARIPQLDQTQAGMTFTQIAAASPSNVWITGFSNGMTINSGPYASDNTYLIHFDGTRWSRVSTPQVAAIKPTNDLSIHNQVTFPNIALTPSGDLWIAGSLSVQGDGSSQSQPLGSYQSRPLLYRYAGGQWANVALPALPPAPKGTPASGNQPAG